MLSPEGSVPPWVVYLIRWTIPPRAYIGCKSYAWITSYGQSTPGEVWAIVEAVREVGAELGKSPAQVALAWALSRPEITVAITGGDTAEHVEDNAGAVGWELPREARERLDAVSEQSLEGLVVV